MFAQTDAPAGPKLKMLALARAIREARGLAYCKIALLHPFPSCRIVYEPSLGSPKFCVLAKGWLVPIDDVRATTNHSPSRKKVTEDCDAAFWYDTLEW